MPTTGGEDKLNAVQGELAELGKAVAALTEHSQANRAHRDATLMAELGEIKGAVNSAKAPIKTWVTGLQLVIAVILGVGGVGGILVAAGSTWQSNRSEIDGAKDMAARAMVDSTERIARLGVETANKIAQVESEMRMRLDTARMEMTQADAIMRQQQQAAGDQIRLLHTTDQAANERMAQVYQSLATITVQNQNLAERMSELGRRQDRLEARLGLSRGQQPQPSGMENPL